MELRAVILVLVIAMVLLVSGFTGCARETTETQAEDLDSELSELESLSEDIENFSLEFNESELEELEGLL